MKKRFLKVKGKAFYLPILESGQKSLTVRISNPTIICDTNTMATAWKF